MNPVINVAKNPIDNQPIFIPSNYQFQKAYIPDLSTNGYHLSFSQPLIKYDKYAKCLKSLNNNQMIEFFNKSNSVHNDINFIKTKKYIYGRGAEAQKMRKLPHFGEPYQKLEMFLKLGKPRKKEIIKLGEMYNDYFKQEIKDLIYPKFGRNQKRSISLAIWFFEDHKEYIIPWLKQNKLID